jgi:hypothetical protein
MLTTRPPKPLVLPGTPIVAECPAVSCKYRVTVCLCTSCSVEMCLGLLAGGVVALVLRLSFHVIRGGTCLRVLLCCCVVLVGLCLMF